MERTLVIADRIAPLSPFARAIGCAQQAVKSLAESRLVVLYGKESTAGSSAVHSIQNVEWLDACPARMDWNAQQMLRRSIKQFRPATISLFSEKLACWLPVIFQAARTTPIQINLVKHPGQLSRPSCWLFNRLPRHVTIQVNSEYLEQHLIREGIKPERIRVTKNRYSVSYQLDNQQDLQLPAGKLISTVAPLQPSANLKNLIWACDLLKCIRDDVSLIVIGEGPQLTTLRSFLRSTEVADQVYFVGWDQHAPEIIAASDVYSEASGLIPYSPALEFAIQRKIPLALPDTFANRHRFSHREDCLMYSSPTRNQLARCLRQLLDERELALQITEKARRTHCNQPAMLKTA